MLRNIQNYRFPDKQSYIINCLAVIKHNVEKSFQQKKQKRQAITWSTRDLSRGDNKATKKRTMQIILLSVFIDDKEQLGNIYHTGN